MGVANTKNFFLSIELLWAASEEFAIGFVVKQFLYHIMFSTDVGKFKRMRDHLNKFS